MVAALTGADAATGKPLAGAAHLAQSIGDILTTPLGSRVMRAEYGSALFALLDAPLTAVTRIRLFAAAAVALARWEPRLRLTRVALGGDVAAGQGVLDIEGESTEASPAGTLLRLSIPLTR